MDDAEIVREVTKAIQVALKRNQRIETIVIVILGCLAFSGIGLLVYGAVARNWQASLPGSISELAIIMPIRYLMRLRLENVRLEALPSLLMLADTAAKKKVVFDSLSKLITQTPS
jgi:hypothetical protein